VPDISIIWWKHHIKSRHYHSTLLSRWNMWQRSFLRWDSAATVATVATLATLATVAWRERRSVARVAGGGGSENAYEHPVGMKVNL
jgi:hypothetical protein